MIPFTGNASLRNDGPAPIELDGYFLTSATDDVLDLDGWGPLADSGATGWTATTSTVGNRLGEVNLFGSLTIDSEEAVSIGAPYSLFEPADFGVVEPGLGTLGLSYTLANDPASFLGDVEFSSRNTVVLLVDAETGESSLVNQSNFDIEIDSYLITSNASALDPSGWNPLGSSDNAWTSAPGASNRVAEGNLFGATSLAANGGSLPVGNLVNAGLLDDESELRLDFTIASTDISVEGGILFAGGSAPPSVCGDFDSDGDVDAADRTTLTTGWTGALAEGGTATFADGDCDGDGDIDAADLTGVIGNWTGALAGNLTDGADADLIYDPTTGNVTLDASDTAAGQIISFVIGTDQNDLRTSEADLPFIDAGTNTDNTTFQIGQTDPLNQGAGPLVDIGNILPTGMDLAALSNYLTIAEYASELGSGGTLDLRVVPEPSSLVLGLFGLLGLATRRRRN